MSTQQQIQLAKSLPSRLIRFFEKFPPPALLQQTSTRIAPIAQPALSPSPSDSNASPTETLAPISKSPNLTPTSKDSELPYHNPFLPIKSYVTGRWRGPVYGLRQQADLVKLASEHGVLDLLPWTVKKPGEKEKRRIERGLQVKGTGEGQKVKGKLWERTLKGRLEKRKQAMLDMPALVQEWKQVSVQTRSIWIRLAERDANPRTERSWARLEEVAKRSQGEMIDSIIVSGRNVQGGFRPLWDPCCIHSTCRECTTMHITGVIVSHISLCIICAIVAHTVLLLHIWYYTRIPRYPAPFRPSDASR
jgi:large subunit ribosomal protein L25